jgi:XTP/dITP diphosphohydrolase
VTLQTILLGTQNKGKLREFQQQMAELAFRLVGLDEFPSIHPVAETGTTFIENAQIKAQGYARQTCLLTLADDSGLEVDALGGAPGVHSARYCSPGASDRDRVATLLAELSQVPNRKRTARFVSVIAIADEQAKIINVSRGVCEGRIALAASGLNGFGYDPIFVPKGCNHTFGDLESDIKNRVSHRARALAEACDFLRALTAPLKGR